MVSQVVTLGQHNHDGVQCLLACGNDLAGGQHETVATKVAQLVAVDQSGVLLPRNPVNAAATRDVCKDNQSRRLYLPHEVNLLTDCFRDVAQSVGSSITLLQLGKCLLANDDQIVVVAQVSGGVAIWDQQHLSVRMEGDVGGDLIGNRGIIFGEGAGLNLGKGRRSSVGIRARIGGGPSLCRERV